MKGKIFRVFIHLFWWIIGILLYGYINDPYFRQLLVNISVLAMVLSYLFPFAERKHEKELKNEKVNKNLDLYNWADTLDGGDNYLRYLFKNLNTSSVQKNIEDISTKILNDTGSNIVRLRYLRAYFKSYKERKIFNLYFKTIGTGILSFVIVSVHAILQGRVKEQSFIELFHPFNSWGFIISIILLALYFFLLPHRGENRINLVVNILDEIIEDKRDKLSEKKDKSL